MDFSKTKVASAAVNHCKLDVSSTHCTTSSFMQLQPVYYKHMLPGEHIKGMGNVISRLAPVAVPTYGRCRLNMRAFFVPFRCVFPNWNEFITDTIASNMVGSALVPKSPRVSSYQIAQYFLTGVDQIYNNPLVRALDPNDSGDAAAIAAGAYDFIISGTPDTYYVFSYYGRLYHKILQSLGYRVIWEAAGDKADVYYSALPLLSYLKVYLDWYANSAYLNNSNYLAAQQLLKFNTTNSQLDLLATDLIVIFNIVGLITYDSGNDVYLNAWDNPMSPNNGLSSSFGINDITDLSGTPPSPTTYVLTNSNNTPVMHQISTSATPIGTTYIHTALKSMTDYVKRNQLSGAYAVDRFLARFGINLDSAKVDRSIYIGSSSVDIDFGSVMQTVNTATGSNPSNLGDYAGQGFGKGGLNFDFKADEFGFFVVMSSILPQGHFFQGFDPNLLHIEKQEFYQPEYDNLGCALIPKGAVLVSTDTGFTQNASLTATAYLDGFGYAPRYYEYKQKSDFVTGDFISPAAMQGGDSWHLSRILDESMFSNRIDNFEHSFALTQGIDAGQYDRIFQYTRADIDKFYLVFNFAAESLAPCKSLFDTYDFDEIGNKLTLDAGGAKVN